MKIAGVSIDPTNIPSKEDFIKLAIVSNQHKDNPLRDKEIESEMKESGLWKEKKVVEPKEEEDGLHTTIAKKDSKPKRE